MSTILIQNREYDNHDVFYKYLGIPWIEFEQKITKDYSCDFSIYNDKYMRPVHYCFVPFGDTLVRFWGCDCVEAVEQYGLIDNIGL